MLRWIERAGVGPADKMRAEFAERISVLAGHNGQGRLRKGDIW